MTGWVGPLKTCFTVDCTQCQCLNNNTDNLPELDIKDLTIKSKPVSEKDPGDPVACCVYSDPNYYYTKPIYTEAVNPDNPNGGDCEDTLYGLPMIGTWYVTSMYNMCYFSELN